MMPTCRCVRSDAKSWAPLKTEMWERGDKIRKVLTVDSKSLFEANGELLPTKRLMRDLRDETSTELLIRNIRLDVEIPRRTSDAQFDGGFVGLENDRVAGHLAVGLFIWAVAVQPLPVDLHPIATGSLLVRGDRNHLGVARAQVVKRVGEPEVAVDVRLCLDSLLPDYHDAIIGDR